MKLVHLPHTSRYNIGLTLVEMMVSLLITTVLLGGVVQIFASTKQSHKLTDSLGFMQESGRMAINLITSDLRRAGYWGGNAALNQIVGGTINPLTPTAADFNTCNAGDNTWALMFTQRVFGLDDTRLGYACVPVAGSISGYLRGDVLAVRYANAQDTTAAQLAANPNTLYIRSTLAAGRVFQGTNAAAAVNQLNGLPLAVYPVVANAYYVGAGSDTCNGASVPSLYQVNIGANGQPQTREIVAGVEDLQVQYGWDTDAVADGIANRYLDANAIAALNWNYPGIPTTNTIVSARVWIIARSACADAKYTDANTYIYADRNAADPYKPNDNYRRQVYSATIALRN